MDAGIEMASTYPSIGLRVSVEVFEVWQTTIFPVLYIFETQVTAVAWRKREKRLHGVDVIVGDTWK